jgi:hypothetical protein
MIINHKRPRMVKDAWRRLTRITNDEQEKFRHDYTRCANPDLAPLSS